jgi:hypothetical protein
VNAPTASTGIPEKLFVLLLALVAAAHVFVFSAAFPFFNNVDEQAHLDLAVRYSHANLPRTLTPPDEEALPYLVIFGTMEYIWPPGSQPGGVIAPPAWKLPADAVRGRLLSREDGYRKIFKNHEAAQPPLYYALAGAWWHLGKVFGSDDARLLYWMRFLNIPILFGLVWLAWLAARMVFPENPFIRVAVPAIVALMPQTAFYSINNDILSPFTGGLLFVMLLIFLQAESLPPGLAAGLGLAFAAAYLTKTSNLPLLAVTGLFISGKLVLLLRRDRLSLRSLAPLILCAGLPIAAWMLWCKTNFDDLTGSALKIRFLGWTDKPFADWWHHPLFTRDGFWAFLSGNLASLWQGEFTWQGKPLTLPDGDHAYVFLTVILLLIAFAAFLWRPPVFTSGQQPALLFSFLCVAAMFAFFALLSIKYDFHDCFYPSTAHPFFISGRLLLGMLIPFLLVCVTGLDRLLCKTTVKFKFLVLTFLLGSMLTAEILQDWQIFANDYNWYHL